MKMMDRAIDGYKNIVAGKYIGIFGNPIKHTLSPIIHDTISMSMNIDEKYIPFHIEDNLGEYVKLAYEEGILGLNITVPYKQDVMPYLVDIDKAAKEIGAVNTLVRVEGGYKGYNTDMPGLARAISSEGISLEGATVVMLGAGGAARAVAYMCLKYNASKVYIINRTVEKAKNIADELNGFFGVDKISALGIDEYDKVMDKESEYIIIQCTSIGLKKDDGLPLVSNDDFYKKASAGVDLIYNPAKTPFIKCLENYGIKAFNGLKMLLYQGVMAYELWNEVVVPEEIVDKVYYELEKKLYGEEAKGNNIVLVGYMGSGKTSVGKRIANEFGYKFIDTDEYIVKKENMTINEIFKTKGEEYFRNLETSVIKELIETTSNSVFSTGGGMPLRRENAMLLKKLGNVYFLRTSADNIYSRVKDSKDRPLLLCDDPKQRIIDMLEERTPKYAYAADYIIDTDGKNINEIMTIIGGIAHEEGAGE